MVKRFHILRYCTLCLCVLMQFSCTTVTGYEPAAGFEALLVGRISLEASGFKQYGSVSVNGFQERDIELLFYDVQNNAKTTVISGRDGVFCLPVFSGHSYRLMKLYYKKATPNGAWASVWNQQPEKVFQVTKSGVTNVGLLLWSADKRGGQSVSLASGEIDSVRMAFEKLYPESEWLNRAWNN